MDRLINISSPQNQLRQNRTLLLLVGGCSTIAGLFFWSLPPFVFNNPTNKVNVILRYLALFGGLSCGISAVVSGKQLERITPLVKAVEQAEKADFFDQLASSQYLQSQMWQREAMTALQSGSTVSQRQPEQVDPEPVDRGSTTSADQLTTSQNAEVTESQHFQSLYKSVSLLKEQGLSDTKIIEEVLGMGGRRFTEGKQMLDTLLTLGQSQGW